MRIIYILKKGLHFFPPCLNQVLVLKDLGCDIVVYHGKESNYINSLLEERNIEHHELASDNYKIGKINQANKLNSPIIKEEANINYGGSLLYGNSINDLTPRHIGNMYAFLYINQKPLIVIGPDCKKHIHLFLFR